MLKRVIDFVGGITALAVLSPVIAFCALGVLVSMGRPVFFTQMRAGLAAAPFRLVKFRTMTLATDSSGKLLADNERLTRFGRFMRSTTLDELPELINVITGDMSIVGPRPLLISYVGRYSPEQARRHEVKPGLTGWAVVNGRNRISWEERLALDAWYVDHQSIWLDLIIVFRTVGLIVRRTGVSAEGHETMPEFRGGSE